MGDAILSFLGMLCIRPATWIVLNAEALILNASAFWWTEGGARSANVATVRIEIPLANRLTSQVIEDMLTGAKKRFVT
jgi:hypothetical protein